MFKIQRRHQSVGSVNVTDKEYMFDDDDDMIAENDEMFDEDDE